MFGKLQLIFYPL